MQPNKNILTKEQYKAAIKYQIEMLGLHETMTDAELLKMSDNIDAEYESVYLPSMKTLQTPEA